MNAGSRPNAPGRARRRGVVLILILSLLGLLAVVGVMFATLSGQSQVGDRYFAESQRALPPESIIDFALEQLINDTTNPASALWGHSLKRDMYGNDAATNSVLNVLPSGARPQVVAIGPFTHPVFGTVLQINTTIPYRPGGVPGLATADFTRHALRLDAQAGAPAQSLEVLVDGSYPNSTLGLCHQLLCTLPDSTTNLAMPTVGATFSLDGRFRNGFNGTGAGPHAIAANGSFANFRFASFMNANANPNTIPMDEDYDAADLDNWFLALRSADNNVVIPSFHRPGILTAADWSNKINVALPLTHPTNVAALASMAKTLRPRAVDHPSAGRTTFPDLVPMGTGTVLLDTNSDGVGDTPSNTIGKIGLDTDGDGLGDVEGFDVDNDGDGKTDSIWVDLGFPAQRDSRGRLFKPLFAFMIEGLNGKLPLNTAGNLNLRNYTATDDTGAVTGPFQGRPLFDHVSHLGTSPSEINPKYAFAAPISYGDGAAEAGPTPGQSFGTYQLQKLLQGNVVASPTVDGRWGDGSLLSTALVTNRFPRPGLSPTAQTFDAEATDDDYRGVDFYQNDMDVLLDAAGALQLPSERFQNFVTPFDVTGNGRVIGWNDDPSLLFNASLPIPATFNVPPDVFGNGFDNRGRSGFFMYFRPPGMPLAAANLPLPLNPPNPTPISANHHNLTHGYESFRNPIADDADPRNARQFWGAMPWNNPTDPMNPNTAPTALPTFVPGINTTHAGTSGAYAVYPGWANDVTIGMGSLDRDHPDEVNLYGPNQADAPFQATDLEWLYRYRDIDGSSLQSRLATLLPEAFVPLSVGNVAPTADDASYRRHLFAIDSWDLNGFAWSNDNPGGFTFNHNSRFNALNATPFASGSAFNLNVATPSLAQRGRRINLNYPLPVDPASMNNPVEPVRQKWVREAYVLLKELLPPKAVDTPEELAQLSQFVVNIIDFRDPDGTITKFVNTDLEVVAPPTDAMAGNFLQKSPSLRFATNVPATHFDSSLDESSGYLVQYGMEYPPVAINEVLAFCYKNQTGDQGRFYLELANTLTRDNGDNVDVNGGTASNLSLEGWDIVITKEDGVHDGEARPNPYTGQLPYLPTTVPPIYRKTAPLSRPSDYVTDPMNPVEGGLINASGQPRKLNALNEAGTVNDASLLLVGYPYPTTTWAGDNIPAPEAILRAPTGTDADGQMTDLFEVPPTDPDTRYHWLYLRRPLYPEKPYQPDPNKGPSSTPPAPDYNPMVVVDSIRFPYFKANAPNINTGSTPNTVSSPDPHQIWSVQRMQPYRGGQVVPNEAYGTPTGMSNPVNFGADRVIDTATPKTLPAHAWIDPTWAAFGYSEQMRYGGDTSYALLDPGGSTSNTNNRTTRQIRQTLDKDNDNDEDWEPLVFHDRDFHSVAELLLVPGCPPGLFTKQFVDKAALEGGDVGGDNEYVPLPPHNTGATPVPNDQPTGAREGDRLPDAGGPGNPYLPKSYPFLVNKFFYSADGQDVDDDATPRIGGPTGTGWHKMLEFFEVPSSALGAIGPVASGENRDWFRQDVRPGLINLNLIIDEEVFFGLFDDPRLNRDTTLISDPNLIPSVVTQVDALGNPTAAYPMNNYGYYDGAAATMKPAFADFLRLRHSNPNRIYFDPINNRAPDPNPVANEVPSPFVINTESNPAIPTGSVPPTYLFGARGEAPFHSLSYPDIRYTVLRPADPQRTAPAHVAAPPYNEQPFIVPTATPVQVGPRLRDYDNGLMERPDVAFGRLLPPQVPPLRLFQVPDGSQVLSNNTSNPASLMLAGGQIQPTYAALTLPNRPTLVNPFVNPAPPVLAKPNTFFLGVGTNNDRREHPYFRTEWLQKVLNLTTVRTHQYAVWVTVGFFEVTKPGDPAMTAINPLLAADQLGPEIGKAQGQQKRYRAFFVIDRTRATGFNPQEPGDFRDLIVYRRRIE